MIAYIQSQVQGHRDWIVQNPSAGKAWWVQTVGEYDSELKRTVYIPETLSPDADAAEFYQGYQKLSAEDRDALLKSWGTVTIYGDVDDEELVNLVLMAEGRTVVQAGPYPQWVIRSP